MGGGRAPCCDKSKVKRGPWSPAEDLRLITFIQKHGHENWRALPKQAGLLRCGKSCRLRWINYLRPDVKRGNFTPQEEETIIKLHGSMGNKWSKIASFLPGRTDNEIKNVWNTHLKKRLDSKIVNSHGEEPKESSIITSSSSSSSSSSSTSFKSYGNQNKDSVAISPRKVSKMALLEETQVSKSTVLELNQSNLTNEAKEPWSSSNSYDSKITNSSDAETPEEVLMDSFFDFNGSYEIHDTSQEISNKELDQEIVLPLESDSDFWNMLDNLDYSLQPNEAQLHEEVEMGHHNHSSCFGEDRCDREAESRKWLRYLENELGLQSPTRDIDQNLQEYVTKDAADAPLVLPHETFHNETTLRQEINPSMAFCQMWPSSPTNFAM